MSGDNIHVVLRLLLPRSIRPSVAPIVAIGI